jgi:hypothetical protein
MNAVLIFVLVIALMFFLCCALFDFNVEGVVFVIEDVAEFIDAENDFSFELIRNVLRNETDAVVENSVSIKRARAGFSKYSF